MDSTNATTQKNRGHSATRARSSHEVGGRGGQDTRSKRDFDRHSGSDKTGVKAVEKRKGGGSHNWGDIQDVIEGQLEPFTVEKFDFGVLKDVGERKSFSVEEEPPKKTMDEYPKLPVEREEPETNVRNQDEDGDTSQ